jgi:uncharacterized OB-fold protein
VSIPTLKSKPISLIYNIPITKTLKFWEGLREGKIYATKCKKCGKAIFPPVADCPDCLSVEMEWFELSGEAEIEAFTHIVIRPLSFQQEKPYTVAIGRMREGVRVLAWLTEAKLSKIKVGLKARLIVKPNQEGEPSYVFVPT